MARYGYAYYTIYTSWPTILQYLPRLFHPVTTASSNLQSRRPVSTTSTSPRELLQTDPHGKTSGEGKNQPRNSTSSDSPAVVPESANILVHHVCCHRRRQPRALDEPKRVFTIQTNVRLIRIEQLSSSRQPEDEARMETTSESGNSKVSSRALNTAHYSLQRTVISSFGSGRLSTSVAIILIFLCRFDAHAGEFEAVRWPLFVRHESVKITHP